MQAVIAAGVIIVSLAAWVALSRVFKAVGDWGVKRFK